MLLFRCTDDVWRDPVSRCRAFIEKHTEPRTQRIVLIDARSVLSWDDWRRIAREYGVVMLRGASVARSIAALSLRSQLHPLAMMLGGALSEACMLVANSPDRASAVDEAVSIIERLLEGLQPRMADGPTARLRSPRE